MIVFPLGTDKKQKYILVKAQAPKLILHDDVTQVMISHSAGKFVARSSLGPWEVALQVRPEFAPQYSVILVACDPAVV